MPVACISELRGSQPLGKVSARPFEVATEGLAMGVPRSAHRFGPHCRDCPASAGAGKRPWIASPGRWCQLIARTFGGLAGLRHPLSPYFASAGASAFRTGHPRW